MGFAKFKGNWFRIDGEIAENHAIPVNLTASIEDLGPGQGPRLGAYIQVDINILTC